MLQSCFNLIFTCIQTLWVWIKSHIFVLQCRTNDQKWMWNHYWITLKSKVFVQHLCWLGIIIKHISLCFYSCQQYYIFGKGGVFLNQFTSSYGNMKNKIILLISLKTFYNISQPLNEFSQTKINLIVATFWYLLFSYLFAFQLQSIFEKYR